jgi:diguanylate cyclase (GGDEF)-like protein
MERRLDSLPAIPLSLGRARRSGPEGIRGADAERFALADQALAVLVLRVANSPLYGRGGTVASIEAALKHLGTAVVRRIAGGLVSQEAPAGGLPLDRPRYLEHYVASAAACRVLARRLGGPPPDEAFAAGLLHSMGQAVLAQFHSRKYAEVLRRAAAESRPIDEIEREVLGFDHGRAGALLAEKWNLPLQLRDAILHHHAQPEALKAVPETSRALVEIVAAANAVLATSGLAGCCRNGRGPPSVKGIPLTREDTAAAVEAARDALREASTLMGFPEGEKPFVEQVREAEAALVAAPAAPRTESDRPSLPDAAKAIVDSVRELRVLATADEAWAVALKGVRAALGVDRALFFAYDAERARLDLRNAFDDTGHIRPGERPLADFPLSPGGALAHAIRDGHPTTVDDLGADLEFLRGLGVSQIVAAPVDILEKTHGVMTVDNVFSGRPLGEDDAAMMGLLATEIGLAISNLLLQKQAQKLRALAERDELTGVNNRRNLMTLFQRELDRSRRYGSVLSVLMVDIDFFKSFNDTYGHQAGDDVLRTIAQVLVSASREIDLIGRYGGEEFVALLPETALEQAMVYAERLRARVELRGQDLRSRFPKTKPLTISGGVTQAMPQAGDDVERIIARVDAALYEAKEGGRNKMVVAQVSGSE